MPEPFKKSPITVLNLVYPDLKSAPAIKVYKLIKVLKI